MDNDPRSRLLDGVLDALPFTVVVVDGDALIVSGNAGWHESATARALELPDAGVGRDYATVLESVVMVEPSDAEVIKAGLAQVLAQTSLFFVHECAVSLFGSTRWFRVVISAKKGATGAVVQHYETTDTHWEQEARSDALAHFRAVFETAIDGIIIFNDDLQFLSGNPAVEQMLGRSVEQLVGKRMTDVLSPEHGEALRRQQRELLIEGTKRGLLQAYRPDGSTIDLEYVARANIVPGRHLAQLRDMTTSREMESQLRQAQKMQAVGQLTGGIAHDFNNILTVIIAHADLLLAPRSMMSPEARDGITEMLRAAQRGADMVRKLMAFGRQEQLRLEAVRIDLLADDMCAILRRVLPEAISVRCTTDPDVPPAMVDATAMQQILFNLATNARDAMHEHGGELHIEVAADRTDAENHVLVTVSDTGVGMSDETLARVFEPFFTTKKVGEGTGLGMAMVYGLTEQMRGRVTVESQVGGGTRVSLRFPAATALTAVDAPLAAATPAATSVGHESLLLVEDDDAIRVLAARVLRLGGYSVVEAHDGESAAECLRVRAGDGNDPFAVVVSDVIMPRGGGARVLDAVKQYAPSARLLWVTGHPGLGMDHDQSHAPSDDPLLQKPWTATELLMRVRAVIEDPRERLQIS